MGVKSMNRGGICGRLSHRPRAGDGEIGCCRHSWASIVGSLVNMCPPPSTFVPLEVHGFVNFILYLLSECSVVVYRGAPLINFWPRLHCVRVMSKENTIALRTISCIV